MDLETVIQSEVGKKKNKYHILMHMHVCGIQQNGTGEPICKAEIDTQMQRTNVCTTKGEVGWDALGDWD